VRLGCSRFGRQLGLALGLLLVAAVSLRGQTPTLEVQVDTTLVTVGDRITMTVLVDHDPDAQVAWPDSLDLGPFELLDAQLLPPTPLGEHTRSGAILALAAFELGELEIPSFPVEIVGPGGESTTLNTNRFVILVESVGLDEGGDIRGLRGPLWIPVSAGRIALWGLALVLAGILVRALYKWWRRRTVGPEEAVPALPLRPAHETALEALAALERSPLLERGEVKEFHIQLSEILRRYVEGRWRVPALEMTTADITSGLTRSGAKSSVVEGFRLFLGQCDMVKFAKDRPDAGASREVLTMGRELVEETIPAPSAPPETPEVASVSAFHQEEGR
jgi:hypothetical protein